MSEDDSTVLEATDVPSTTFLSKVVGIDDLEDVFKPGSEGDLQICETFVVVCLTARVREY